MGFAFGNLRVVEWWLIKGPLALLPVQESCIPETNIQEALILAND